MFALPCSERNGFYTLLPNGWTRKSNCALEVTALLKFSYLAHQLCMTVSRVCKHLGCLEQVKIEMPTFGAFLRTASHVVVNCLATDDMTVV